VFPSFQSPYLWVRVLSVKKLKGLPYGLLFAMRLMLPFPLQQFPLCVPSLYPFFHV